MGEGPPGLGRHREEQPGTLSSTSPSGFDGRREIPVGIFDTCDSKALHFLDVPDCGENRFAQAGRFAVEVDVVSLVDTANRGIVATGLKERIDNRSGA